MKNKRYNKHLCDYSYYKSDKNGEPTGKRQWCLQPSVQKIYWKEVKEPRYYCEKHLQ